MKSTLMKKQASLLLLGTVSLLSLGFANSTYAQCSPAETAGNDTITCSGTNGAQLFNDGGNDAFTIASGSSITRSGNGSVLRIQNSGDVDLTNNGNIEITGGNARFQDTVLLQQITGNINITNTGTILNNSTTNTAISAAIQIARDSNFNTFTLNNSGTISSTRQGIYFGSLSRGNHINTNYVSSTITNQAGGIIEATGSVQDVIFFNAGNDTLINNGTLIGNVTFGAGDDVFEIDLDTGSFTGDADGGTHNAGDALTIHSGSNAIVANNFSNFEDLNLRGDQDFTITGTSSFENIILENTTDLIVGNGGSLTATVGMTGTAGNNVTVDSGGTLNADTTLTGANETFTINGDVIGDIILGDGDDVLNINLDTGSYSGSADADGGTMTGDDDLNFVSAQNQNINLDSYTNFEDLSFDGNGTFSSANGSSGIYDTASLLNNTNLIVGNDSTITTNIFSNTGTNDVTILSGGVIDTVSFAPPTTLTFDVATDTKFGFLNVTGGPIDLRNTSVTTLVTDAVTDADEVKVATGSGALIGLDGSTGQTFTDIDDTSLLFNFGIADGSQGAVTSSIDPNSLFIIADKVFLIRQVIEEGNEVNVGEVLEVLETIPPGINDLQIQAVLGQVNSASNAEELAEVLQAALPVLDTGAFSAAQNVTGNTLRLVSDRLTVIRDNGGSKTGVSSGDVTEDLQMWGQIFGQKINQGTRKGIAGFDAWTRGLTLGLDTEILGEDTTAGVAFSYANTDVNSKSLNNTRSDIHSYNLSVYGDYDLTDSAYLVGDLGYTYGDNETTRFNVGGVSGLNADSDYDSHQLEARLIAAYDYDIEEYDGLRITPKVQAHYIHYQAEDVTETGAGGAGLNVDNDSFDILEFGIGVDVRKDRTLYNGGVISPEVTAGYRYDVIGDNLQTTSTFVAGGPSFESEGATPDQHTFNLGFGIGYTALNNVEFTASYDYEHKDEYNSHSALFRLAAPF